MSGGMLTFASTGKDFTFPSDPTDPKAARVLDVSLIINNFYNHTLDCPAYI